MENLNISFHIAQRLHKKWVNKIKIKAALENLETLISQATALYQGIGNTDLQAKVFLRVVFRTPVAESTDVFIKCAESQEAHNSQVSQFPGWYRTVHFKSVFSILGVLCYRTSGLHCRTGLNELQMTVENFQWSWFPLLLSVTLLQRNNLGCAPRVTCLGSLCSSGQNAFCPGSFIFKLIQEDLNSFLSFFFFY